MKSIYLIFICSSLMLSVLHLWGCHFNHPKGLSSIEGQNRHLETPSAEGRLTVYCFRHANFTGGGRTHVLEIDNNVIGPLTAGNYYRLEMWPGEYHFTISLPREEFFGQVDPPITLSRQINLIRHAAGNTYIFEYTDGMGSGGFAIQRITVIPKALSNRTLAGNLDARKTAQLTQFYDARYDGPAMNGRPHGQGTLNWPDGGIYKGIFRHGTPTREAKFYFPDGHIFMGPNYRGRPTSPGVLMSPQGHILFAGNFVNEKPHGVGMRSGPNGPEFCEYENGNDITKTFRDLAKEALDVEDQQTIDTWQPDLEDLSAAENQSKTSHQMANKSLEVKNEQATLERSDPVDGNTTEKQSQKQQLTEQSVNIAPEKLHTDVVLNQQQLEALEKEKKRLELETQAEKDKFIKQLRASRYEREIAKEKVFRKLHQAKVEKERQWCREEFNQGRNLCTCAALADDFDLWQECWEPLRKRYID